MWRFLLVAIVIVAPAGVSARGPEVQSGGLVRWPGEAISACGMADETWAPVDSACWYPVDLHVDAGPLVLKRWSAQGVQERAVEVGDYPYPTQELTVDPKHVSPDEAALARISEESRQIAVLWSRRGPVRFSLPLGPPLAKLSGGTSFGNRRIFNGEPRNPHSGVDFKASKGTPVLAVADGEVVLVGDHYFAGNSVYLDHGGGLITMVCHLETIAVAQGDLVHRGQVLGRVGATGRATGPHLHFGLRWLGARIDPRLLLGTMDKVVEIPGDS